MNRENKDFSYKALIHISTETTKTTEGIPPFYFIAIFHFIDVAPLAAHPRNCSSKLETKEPLLSGYWIDTALEWNEKVICWEQAFACKMRRLQSCSAARGYVKAEAVAGPRPTTSKPIIRPAFCGG